MKAVTITLPEDLDAQAAEKARRRGISKSELIRLCLAKVLAQPSGTSTDDPGTDLAGFVDPKTTIEPWIDDTIYGP